MRKLRIALCALCLALLALLLPVAWRTLPVDTRPLIAEKYAGWSGVLRLWVYEGWPCGGGSIAPWLNRCVGLFEKSHPGVYIQPQYVDAGAIASLNDSGILPPDLLLFPPGLLETPVGLAPLAVPDGLRGALADCGRWRGETYAAPVAMGGYLWAWNVALTDGVPETWRDGGAVLAVPTPEAWRRWDVALLALCSGRYAAAPSGGSSARDVAAPRALDIGLAADDTPAPSPSPTPDPAATLPRRLPENFKYDGDAWRHFINGEAAAMPVTQREARRLQALSDQGKGPDWQLSRGDGAFSDQLLCLAVVDRPDGAERRALCQAFLSLLLTDECQGGLCLASAFAVTDAESGYEPGDPLAAMDAALRDAGLCVPPVFGSGWVSAAEGIVREFITGTGEAPSLWPRLRKLLAEYPNI